MLVAGLVLGLGSSLHCAVMCGPLTLALRRSAGGWWQAAVYHGARVSAYALLGGVAGLLGRVAALGGVSGALSLGLGAFLVLAAVASARRGGLAGIEHLLGGGRLTRPVAELLTSARAVLGARPLAGAALAGALNALIPCGMLYAALAASAAAPTPALAAGAMAAYGVGTCPPLAVMWWSFSRVRASRAGRWRLATPVALAIAGLLLVGRGVVEVRQAGGARGDHASPAVSHHMH